MAAIRCFNIPPGTIPQAEKVYKAAVDWAERYREVLTIDLRKQVALGYVTKWACQQDEPQKLDRIGEIVRQAGDLVVSRYCLDGTLA